MSLQDPVLRKPNQNAYGSVASKRIQASPLCVTSSLAAEAEAEVVGDAEVDASAVSTSADGGLDAGRHGSKDVKEKDPPNVRWKGGTVK